MEKFAKNLSANNESDVDIISLMIFFKVVWAGKLLIIAVTSFFTLLGVIYALMLPNQYQSTVLLAPANDGVEGAAAGLGAQLGGIASLAGISLSGESDKSKLALEVLKSRKFLVDFVKNYELTVVLLAAEDWDELLNKVVISESVYSEEEERWQESFLKPMKSEPTDNQIYESIIERLYIRQDKDTSFVVVGFEFFSPYLAQEWLKYLLFELNEEIRNRDVVDANKSIEYLTDQVSETSLSSMKSMFYELIEEQTRIVMFAEARDEYVFKIIDEAFLPEERSRPARKIIVFIACFLGGTIGVLLVLFRWLYK